MSFKGLKFLTDQDLRKYLLYSETIHVELNPNGVDENGESAAEGLIVLTQNKGKKAIIPFQARMDGEVIQPCHTIETETIDLPTLQRIIKEPSGLKTKLEIDRSMTKSVWTFTFRNARKWSYSFRFSADNFGTARGDATHRFYRYSPKYRIGWDEAMPRHTSILPIPCCFD